MTHYLQKLADRRRAAVAVKTSRVNQFIQRINNLKHEETKDEAIERKNRAFWGQISLARPIQGSDAPDSVREDHHVIRAVRGGRRLDLRGTVGRADADVVQPRVGGLGKRLATEGSNSLPDEAD